MARGRGVEMIAQGGGGVGGGPQSFCCLKQHTSHTSGRREGDPWDGVEVPGLGKRLRQGGRVQSFLFMFRKIETDGMRPNLLSRSEKGGLGGEVKVRGIGK